MINLVAGAIALWLKRKYNLKKYELSKEYQKVLSCLTSPVCPDRAAFLKYYTELEVVRLAKQALELGDYSLAVALYKHYLKCTGRAECIPHVEEETGVPFCGRISSKYPELNLPCP